MRKTSDGMLNSNHQSSPAPYSKKEPADEIEKAIFDLQDVKNCYEIE